MRNSLILDALLPRIRQAILATLFANSSKWWYLSELAAHLKLSPSSLQREVESLTRAGLLAQRREGKRVYYRAASESPVFAEISGLMDKTAGIILVLEKSLRKVEAKIDCCFVYGSVARSEESSQSDLDLMVIGLIGLAEMVPTLREAERVLRRQINPTVYTASEFRRKYRARDHFLSTVLAGRVEFVKGDRVGLERIAGDPRHTTASDQQAGDR